MAIFERYSDYFNIDPEYFPAVNEQLIKKRPELWQKFFPHAPFVKLLQTTLNVLDRKRKLSIWVEGAYGTGKSHAVLTEMKLLEASEEETKKYFDKFKGELDNDLYTNLQRIKNSGKILTVHRYGSSNIKGDNDLLLAVQESVEAALKREGLDNGGASLRDSVVRYLSDPENKASFNIYVKGSYKELFQDADVDSIIDDLKNFQDKALLQLMGKIFKVAQERQIRAFSLSAKELCLWLENVIRANNLKAILFIWDEFTEYFKNNKQRLTGFQELCELSQTQPFYFILVTHLSAGLFSDGDKEFTKINGRFIAPHCLLSLPENIAFQLMGAAMEKNKEPEIQNDWNKVVKDLAESTYGSRKRIHEVAGIDDDLMRGILPIHPYAAHLLKHISSVFASDQRSMFDFIKNDRGDDGDIKAFQWFIKNCGPEDDNPLLTVDMLWDFFYEHERDTLARDVRSILDYFGRVVKQIPARDDQSVLKTVLLLQAISLHAGDAVELFIPNDQNVCLAFQGTDLEQNVQNILRILVKDKILFQKDLGDKKYQYAAYINGVSDVELDKFKKQVDDKSTASLIMEPLGDNESSVARAVTFEDDGALSLRYEIKPVSVTNFDSTLRALENKELVNKIPALVCFARNDDEVAALAKKIKGAIKNDSYPVVIIDATTTPLGTDGYDQYRNAMANSLYQNGKDGSLASQYAFNAHDVLRKWARRIRSGEFVVYSAKRPDGDRANSFDTLKIILKSVTRERFPRCLEASWNVTATMYQPSSLKLGVECGAMRKTRNQYSSSNTQTKLENAIGDAWKDPRYWETHPSLLISQIKFDVDELIHREFKSVGRVSIRDVYDMLKTTPYGFLPCNLTAFVLGFVLADYTHGEYTWSDGITNDVLDLEKLKEMIEEIVKLQLTPSPRYKEKYIVAMTEEETAFIETTAHAFGIDPKNCSSVEQTRGYVRERMKKLSFPIWTLKSILTSKKLKSDSELLGRVIDLYCGIANSGNIAGSRSDSDIALEIGKLCLKHPDVKEDLKTLLTKENCNAGMLAYLQEFEGGELIRLAEEVDDKGQYINVLRSKFDADAANWVWNLETAQQKIREVILEYHIIAESNKTLQRQVSFKGAVDEWLQKCDLIRISWNASKNYLGSVSEFLELLYTVKSTRTILDSQKQKFYDLLVAHATDFIEFFDSQLELFKKVAEHSLKGLSDEEIRELWDNIPAGSFTKDKTEYLNLVDAKVKEYRSSLEHERLKKLWSDKTGTVSPRQWSEEHLLPILSLVPDDEVSKAKAAFDAVNAPHPDKAAVDGALTYLENATFYPLLEDKTELDRIFCEKIVRQYDVVLPDVEQVKLKLSDQLTASPYEWFGLPEVQTRLEQIADEEYRSGGVERALERIDGMDADSLKSWLKKLIRNNMTLGLEIIREN